MQETKKRKNGNNESKKKERHIVTWTQEEDDILREQINLHGTENWAIIASKFKDKSTRQCRRRWYTYLNSDFKRGGWSPEEDILLCEAQRVFGNRWTEIAKVVSGRTDNAVKNRFTTLCKKKAKYEAMAKENRNACVNSNNKKLLFPEGKYESEKKMRRSHILDLTTIKNYTNRSQGEVESGMNKQIRSPLSILKEIDGKDKDVQRGFLKKDDPKVTALMQQAEFLSSLAQKVNADHTDQSMENAWKVLQDLLNKSKENEIFRYGITDIDFEFEEFKDLVEDLRSSNEESQSSWRQPDLHDSPASSQYSTGSTIIAHQSGDKTQQILSEIQAIDEQDGGKLQSCLSEKDKGIVSNENLDQVDLLSTCEIPKNPNEIVPITGEEFNSPVQVTPLFKSLAAGIPSPQFSESERNFLLKTLGVESPSPCPNANPSQPPPCKRVLLHSL